jgi:hypothetical protein
MSDVFNANININATDNTKATWESVARNTQDATKAAGNAVDKNYTDAVKRGEKATENLAKATNEKIAGSSPKDPKSVTGAFNLAAEAVGGMAEGMLGAVAAVATLDKIVNYGKESYKAFANAEMASKSLAATNKMTAHEVEETMASFEKLGPVVGKQVLQLAADYRQLRLQSGESNEHLMTLFPLMEKFTAATQSNFSQAIQMITEAQRAGGVKPEDMPEYINRLGTTLQGLGPTAIEVHSNLQRALKNVGVAGGEVGQQLAVTLKALGEGGNFPRAAAQLEAVFNKLNAWKGQIIIPDVWEKFTKGQIGVLEVMNEIEKQAPKAGMEFRLRFMNDPEFRALITQLREVKGRTAEINEENKNAKRALEDNPIFGPGAAQALEKLSQAAEHLQVAVGALVSPVATSLINTYSDAVNGLADALERLGTGKPIITPYVQPPETTISPRPGPPRPPGGGFYVPQPAPTRPKGYQHGGMVTEPTLAMLGEAGPEMVMPMGAGMGAPGPGQPPMQDIDRPDPAMAGLWRAISRNRRYRPGIDPTAVMGGLGGLGGGGGGGGWGPGGGRGGGGGPGGSGRGGSGSGGSGGGGGSDTGAGGSGEDRSTDEWLRGSETAKLEPLGLLTDALKKGGGQLPEGTIGGPGGTGAGQEGGTGPGGSGESLKGSEYLKAQRAGFAAELQKNPALKQKLAALIVKENLGAGTGVAESLFNRMAMSGGTIQQGIYGGRGKSFYGPIRKGIVNWTGSAEQQRAMRTIDAALAGSNVIQMNTDQGSPGDPNYTAGGTGININRERFNDWGGYRGVAYSRRWREEQQRRVAQGGTVTTAGGAGAQGAGGYTPYGAQPENTGSNVPSDLLKEASGLAAMGSPTAVKRMLAAKGYRMDDNWCGDFVAAAVKMSGGVVPKDPAVASNWLRYGTGEAVGHPGDVVVRKSSRFGGAAQPGSPGSHTAIVESIDPQKGTFTMLGGNQGPWRRTEKISNYYFRHSPGPGRSHTAATPAGPHADHFGDKSWAGHPTHEQGGGDTASDHTVVDPDHIRRVREQLSKPIKTKVEIETPQHIETTRRTAARQTARWDRIAEDRHDRHRASANLGFA